MIDRYDYDMPFMLRYENVAWYEDGLVKILDRRIYPKKINFVICKTYKEVAQAISDMVTQSAGPYTACGMGMALAAYEARELSKEEKMRFLEKAASTLSNARPTTANRMGKVTSSALEVAKKAIKEGKDVDKEIFLSTIASLNRRYRLMDKVAENLTSMIKDEDKVLTQCFGETIIGTMGRMLKKQGKNVRFFCAETGPYLQGARLTATCLKEMGFDTTVIADNMIAFAMEKFAIDLFTSAADTITCDGHVANKVGTFQIAILAKHFGIPYFVTGVVDSDKKTRADIKIEYRDPKLVLGDYTYKGVKSIYPSFDITPPGLIDKIVTEKGIFDPYKLDEYLKIEDERFY